MPASGRTAQVTIRQFPEKGQVVAPPPAKKPAKKRVVKRTVKRVAKKDCP
jgi:hypothetical protein